jgi:NAD(P)-dependent dehydrogenase (short-subunit alcohol dehydrogenase family)
MERDGAQEAGSMAGRVCLVTGANAGIGYHTALRLATMGARIICGKKSLMLHVQIYRSGRRAH